MIDKDVIQDTQKITLSRSTLINFAKEFYLKTTQSPAFKGQEIVYALSWDEGDEYLSITMIKYHTG